MFDINNGIEDIKRRDKITVLDREFPGGSCGNAECENLCAEALCVAKAMRLDPKIMLEDSIKQGIAPQTHCVPASAEFTPPFFTAPCRFGFVRPNDHLPLSESSNDSSYVFRAKPGSCEKCQSCDGITIPADKMQDEKFMKNFGFWKQKDGVFRPHPNCDCKWEKTDAYGIIPDQAETKNNSYDRYHSELRQGKGYTVQFHVVGSPPLPKVLGESTVFNGINDLVTQLEKKYPKHSIEHLIISNHSGGAGCVPTNKDGDDELRHLHLKQNANLLERLKKMLSENAILELRMCRVGEDEYGSSIAQDIANAIGCRVIVYRNKVNPAGGKAPFTFLLPGKKVYSPQIEK